VFDLITDALTAVGGAGVWSDSSNDPVSEIDEQINAIATEIGRMPNRIVFGLGAWRAFRNHDKVIERQPGAQLIGVTTQQAAQMMLNPGVDVRVGVLSKDSTKFGKTKSATNIVGAEVFIFFGSSAPSTYDPSFAKTFMTRRGGVDQVREYRDEAARSDIFAVDWTEDTQVVSDVCGRRISIS